MKKNGAHMEGIFAMRGDRNAQILLRLHKEKWHAA
jgi:hypothetical protein